MSLTTREIKGINPSEFQKMCGTEKSASQTRKLYIGISRRTVPTHDFLRLKPFEQGVLKALP